MGRTLISKAKTTGKPEVSAEERHAPREDAGAGEGLGERGNHLRRVGGREGHSQPRGAQRYRRRPDRRHVEALSKQRRARGEGVGGVADDDRYDVAAAHLRRVGGGEGSAAAQTPPLATHQSSAINGRPTCGSRPVSFAKRSTWRRSCARSVGVACSRAAEAAATTGAGSAVE